MVTCLRSIVFNAGITSLSDKMQPTNNARRIIDFEPSSREPSQGCSGDEEQPFLQKLCALLQSLSQGVKYLRDQSTMQSSDADYRELFAV